MRRCMRWLLRGSIADLALSLLALLVVYLIPVHTTVRPIQPRADTQYWRMQGGYRIAYTKLTPPADTPRGMPVVFLHGGPGGYVHSSVIQALRPLAEAGHEDALLEACCDAGLWICRVNLRQAQDFCPCHG